MDNQGFIHCSAKIVDCEITGKLNAFRNVEIYNSTFRDNVSIGDDSIIRKCKFEDYIAINRRNYINNSEIGAFTYTGLNTIVNFAKIGRFCSIARNVDIGGFDHDYSHITTLPLFRYNQMCGGGGKILIPLDAEIRPEYCHIGNDVWIAAGAQILHKANIGDGAIIGAGAVVSSDIEPYSIAVGIPAKIIKYRFDKKYIDELLKMQWWNWPLDIIKENAEWLIHTSVNDDSIKKMWSITDMITNET